MKLLITGICGFVGSSLAKFWHNRADGTEVFGIDNFSRRGSEINREILTKMGIKVWHGDIRVNCDLEALPRADWVIDAAANPSVLAGVSGNMVSRQLVENNLSGTINVLEYCKKMNAGFILLSTSRVYSIEQLSRLEVSVVDSAFTPVEGQKFPVGLSCSGISENLATSSPISLYGATKLSSEILAMEYGAAFGFPVWINRCGVIAGAGQFGRADQGIFSFWINAFLRKKRLKYTGFGGKGYQVRDCLHPEDLFDLINMQFKSVGKNVSRIVNVGGGLARSVSLANLSRWCTEKIGFHEIEEEDRPRTYDIPWLVMDCGLAEKEFGWKPKISLNMILHEILEHAEKQPDWLFLSGSLNE